MIKFLALDTRQELRHLTVNLVEAVTPTLPIFVVFLMTFL